MTIKLEDFTVLCDIQARLKLLTPEQVDLMATRLNKKEPSETLVGEVSELCRAMWALSVVLGAEEEMEKALAKQLADPMIVEDHEQRAMIASELGDVVKELVWAQARSDTGYWKGSCLSIREGWMLASAPSCGNHPPGLEGVLAILRGGLPG